MPNRGVVEKPLAHQMNVAAQFTQFIKFMGARQWHADPFGLTVDSLDLGTQPVKSRCRALQRLFNGTQVCVPTRDTRSHAQLHQRRQDARQTNACDNRLTTSGPAPAMVSHQRP
jgi:hypothetical protein